jgi:hypothetical protein
MIKARIKVEIGASLRALIKARIPANPGKKASNSLESP